MALAMIRFSYVGWGHQAKGGCPKRTWMGGVRINLKKCNLLKDLLDDRLEWKKGTQVADHKGRFGCKHVGICYPEHLESQRLFLIIEFWSAQAYQHSKTSEFQNSIWQNYHLEWQVSNLSVIKQGIQNSRETTLELLSGILDKETLLKMLATKQASTKSE